MKATDIVVADAFFSIRPFVDGIKECGFHLVSRFRDTASLYYVYTGPRSNKPGRPKTLDGKINYKKLDLTRMAELYIEGLEGTAYTLIVYSKALNRKCALSFGLCRTENTSFSSQQRHPCRVRKCCAHIAQDSK